MANRVHPAAGTRPPGSTGNPAAGGRRSSQASLLSVPSFYSVDGLRLNSFNNDGRSSISAPGMKPDVTSGNPSSISSKLEQDNPWDFSPTTPMHIIEVKDGKNGDRKVNLTNTWGLGVLHFDRMCEEIW